jgi:hypothetical protein
VKEGWLTKQGGERKNWKKRWFLLQDNILYYFADQKVRIGLDIGRRGVH